MTEFSKGPTLGGLKTRFQGTGHGTVDAQRHIDKALNQFDHLPHQGRFGLVRVGVRVVDDARVHIQHLRAAGHLFDGVLLDGRKVPGFQFGGEDLAARGVDPLANDAERFVKSDDDGFVFDSSTVRVMAVALAWRFLPRKWCGTGRDARRKTT